MRNYSIKIFSLLILLFSFTDSIGQACSGYTTWVQATYYNGEQINLNGTLYTPCYSSTAAPLTDPYSRTEGGCGTTAWGYIGTCTTCTDPTITGSATGSRCGTGGVVLQATASGGSIKWWTASSGGTLAGTSTSGVDWTTPDISSTTTYYAEGIDGACTSAARTAVTATVTANPTVTGSTTGSRCGTGTVVLQATASAGSIKWYTASSGGSLAGSSSSGVNWTTPSISSTTTYYAEALNGSCTSASRTSVTATVNAQPTVTGSTTGSRCGTGTVAIQASASSGSIEWFTASSGGSSVGSSTSGVNWTTPSISSTTTYYAEADNGTCTSAARTSVSATVTADPTVSGSTTGARCNSGTVLIQATASAGSIDWYTASSGGSSVGSSATGVDWTTPSISSTTIYYAEAINGSCTSASRTSVTATVNTASAGPAGLTDELFLWLKADAGSSSISSSWEDQSCNGFDYTTVTGPSKISADWNYNPAIEILSGGFDAPAGSELGTDWTIFFVSKLLASDKTGRFIEAHSGNYLLGYHGGYANSIYWSGAPSEYNSGIASSSTSSVESPHVFTYVRESSGSTLDARMDGDALKTFTSTNSGAGIRLDINQGTYESSESTDSRIGEFIIFSKELTDSEIMKVETYLAAKYAISLSDDDGSTGGDYISSGGTTLWDASLNTAYNNDIIVIGKDDNSALEQKQASSEDDSLIIFISSLETANASNAGSVTNDESFLAIGHNAGVLYSNAAVNSEFPSGISTRFEREWKITNTNFDDDFSLEIEWQSGTTVDLSHLRLLVDDNGDFSDATAYSSADGLTFSIGSIIINGITTSMIPKGSTKYITVASANILTTLPVDLTAFNAIKEKDYVILSWETMMELNNDYFLIEKSSDGTNWTTLAQVAGAGNSDLHTIYSQIDYDGCPDLCYYRLTQIDFDGTSKVYKSIAINTQVEKEALSIQVNPNPIGSEANIQFNAPSDNMYNLRIISNTGQLIYSAKILGITGKNNFTYPCSTLPKGIYSFTISNQNGTSVQKKVLKN